MVNCPLKGDELETVQVLCLANIFRNNPGAVYIVILMSSLLEDAV